MGDNKKKKRGKKHTGNKADRHEISAVTTGRGVTLLKCERRNPNINIGFPHPGSRLTFDNSDILSVILGYLNRCEDETFTSIIHSAGGDLKSPSAWIELLSLAAGTVPSSHIKIVKSIEPMVRCMCRDTTRLFFKSNKHWAESIEAFVMFVSNMLLISETNAEVSEKKIIRNTILQYDEGLLIKRIAQWGFWGHRPDILEELEERVCKFITSKGRQLIKLFVSDLDNFHEEQLTEDGMSILRTFATSPIINSDWMRRSRTCLVTI